jgi:large subunit ribosomal protein L6
MAMVALKIKVVEVPQGIEVGAENNVVKVKAGDRELEKAFPAKDIEISVGKDGITVKPANRKRSAYAKANTAASIIDSMVKGAAGRDYEYKLEMVYSHFPITAVIKGKDIEISNLRGAKKPKTAKIVGNTKVEIKGKAITVKGSDKQWAGQTAANIEKCTRRSNTDRRVFQDGIYITEKA